MSKRGEFIRNKNFLPLEGGKGNSFRGKGILDNRDAISGSPVGANSFECGLAG